MEDKVVLLENIDEISQYGADKLYDLSEKLEKVKVAFSGGDTPKQLLKKLAKMDIKWEKIEIFAVDEKFISPKSIKSNYRIVEKNLLEKIKIPDKNIHWIKFGGELKDRRDEYELEIKSVFNLKKNEIPEFDLIFLGLNKDGTTASIFQEVFKKDDKRLVITAENIKNIEYSRISLNLNVLNKAKNILFLISGKDKGEIFKQVYKKENKNTPLYNLKLKNGILYYVIDKDVMRK